MTNPVWLQDITAGYLNRALCRTHAISPPCKVKTFDVIGFQELEQSEVATLDLEISESDTHVVPCDRKQVLLKRYNMQRLKSRIKKSDEKWRISAASFANEHAFCSTMMSQREALSKAGVRLPEIYLAEDTSLQSGRGNDGGLDSSYDFLFEYLSPRMFHQSSVLGLSEAKSALELIARFHAYFWVSIKSDDDDGADDHLKDLRASLFRRGAWWRKELRPSVRYDRIPEAFRSLCLAFPEQELMGRMDSPEAHELMKVLAERVDEINLAVANAPNRTVVHGDFKTSNLFFGPFLNRSNNGPISARAQTDNEAFCIDFQWTGNAPSGLSDVMYLLYGGVEFSIIQHREMELLRHYWEELDRSLKVAQKPEYSWDQCLRDADTEYLAYFITALPQLMDGLSNDVCLENVDKYGWLTHEKYPQCVSLICEKALKLLKEWQS